MDDEVMSEDAALLSMFFFSVSVCFLGGVRLRKMEVMMECCDVMGSTRTRRDLTTDGIGIYM